MPRKPTRGWSRAVVLALAILADVAPVLVEGQGTGMGMVNGVGPNNSTVKATRLVRSRKVPFHGPEFSPPYVVVYFFCALITVLSCTGIAVTEYHHRKFRKNNRTAQPLELTQPAGMPPRATLFLPPPDQEQQQEQQSSVEDAPQSAEEVQKAKSTLVAEGAPMSAETDPGVKRASSSPAMFKSMSGLLDMQKRGLLQTHTPRPSEDEPLTSARRMSEDERKKASLMLDVSHNDHMYMDSTLSSPTSGAAGGLAAGALMLNLTSLQLEDGAADLNMSMEDPAAGLNLSPTSSSVHESSTLGPLPPLGEGPPVLLNAARVGYRSLSSAPSPDRSSAPGTPSRAPPDANSSMQSLVQSLGQAGGGRHVRMASLDGSGSHHNAFGSVLSSSKGSSRKFDDAESVAVPFGSAITGYGPSREGVSRRASGASASNSALSAASQLPSTASTHNYSMPGSTIDSGSSALRPNISVGAVDVQTIETMRLNMRGVDAESSVAPLDSSQATVTDAEEAGSGMVGSTLSASDVFSDTTALLGNNNGGAVQGVGVFGNAADAYLRLLADSSGDGSLQDTVSGHEEIGPDDINVLETSSLLGNR